MTMDPASQMSEMRRLGAAPQWVVGSVHALTQDGDLVIASASGSQLASMAYGAQNVLLVIGTQKIVPVGLGDAEPVEHCRFWNLCAGRASGIQSSGVGRAQPSPAVVSVRTVVQVHELRPHHGVGVRMAVDAEQLHVLLVERRRSALLRRGEAWEDPSGRLGAARCRVGLLQDPR